MVEVGVLEESEAENSAAPDFGEDGAAGVLGSLCDGPDFAAARLREPPAQLAEHAVGNLKTQWNVPAAPRRPRAAHVRQDGRPAGWLARVQLCRRHHGHRVWCLNLCGKFRPLKLLRRLISATGEHPCGSGERFQQLVGGTSTPKSEKADDLKYFPLENRFQNYVER